MAEAETAPTQAEKAVYDTCADVEASTLALRAALAEGDTMRQAAVASAVAATALAASAVAAVKAEAQEAPVEGCIRRRGQGGG